MTVNGKWHISAEGSLKATLERQIYTIIICAICANVVRCSLYHTSFCCRMFENLNQTYSFNMSKFKFIKSYSARYLLFPNKSEKNYARVHKFGLKHSNFLLKAV